jgi:2-oxo-4-hydroxy-4-carboxy-5-ureidoimidazoline decarboxylase
MMTLDAFNALPEDEARQALTRCCGATSWAEQVVARRPFEAYEDLLAASADVSKSLKPQDWLEAFSHHPKIGDVESLRKKFAATRNWSESEQQSVQQASTAVLERLAHLNDVYEQKYGFIFIVCATGKSADEMLAMLESRLNHDPEVELAIAAAEQDKITRIRLDKLFDR